MKYVPLIVSALSLVACSSKPVRHLASDAALLRPNATTQTEMHRYLGEARAAREVAPGVKEYVYVEDIVGFWGKMPVLGKTVGSRTCEMLIVTVADGVVRDVVFRGCDAGDREWVEQDDRE